MTAATSLRCRALLWMTVPPIVVGAIAFVVAYMFDLREANKMFDAQLQQVALYAGVDPETAPPPFAQDPGFTFVLRVWSPGGALLHATPGAVELPPPDRPGFATIEVKGERWRVYSTSDSRRAIAVAQRMAVRDAIGRNAGIEAALPVLLATMLTWLAIGWMVRDLGTRLRSLAETIANRSLDSRVPVPLGDAPVEVAPIVEGMNALTLRLQEAIDRQKRFVADAAHELRTPLTALQIQLDNLAAEVKAPGQAAVRDFRAGLGRARALLEQLLRLARSESDLDAGAWEDVDISALVKACVADLVPLAEAKGVDLGLACGERVTIRGARSALALLFGNLIENAVRYTPGGGAIDVGLWLDGDRFVFDVIDSGCGVAEADIARLFDRFFRAAPAGAEGSGLGLSIAQAVADRHGLSIALRNRPDAQGFWVRVAGVANEGGLIRS